jgi:hypothetical protein
MINAQIRLIFYKIIINIFISHEKKGSKQPEFMTNVTL